MPRSSAVPTELAYPLSPKIAERASCSWRGHALARPRAERGGRNAGELKAAKAQLRWKMSGLQEGVREGLMAYLEELDALDEEGGRPVVGFVLEQWAFASYLSELLTFEGERHGVRLDA